MRWFLATAFLPTLLANASPVDFHHHVHHEEHNETLRLFRRVRTGPNGELLDPKTASDLFLLDSGPGGCIGREGTLDPWVEEAMLLHSAVETAYANIRGDRSWMLLWLTWFGVQLNMQTGDVDLSDEANKRLWETIGDHISRVTRFLSGAGLQNPDVPGENPRIFCGPEAGVVQPWRNSVVRDREGRDVVAFEDPETGAREYLTLGDAFVEPANNPKARAFWFDSFNGYDLDYGGEDSLCAEDPVDGRRRYAKVARPASSWPPIFTDDAEFEFGRANRHILFCPPSFEPGGSHSYPSLARAIDEDYYPTAGLRDVSQALDRMLTVSATMYHELYHLTDADNTPDVSYNLNTIVQNAQNPDTREANSHNPETYTYFAMAAYLLLRAPDGEEPCLYMGGLPKRASNPFA
ncbi:hypothetical protein BDV12DRAFT_190800 [Aspergillus spectabilis]